ncbi:poly-beta-1,6-N-acetyl-D-glucosamine synthase [Halioxenophilus aromaticivorans]|uniref:Poly-beta-1,6-N-acetyl-D-glucosamine synthase n=1 Tax=Halioxenophilus aromaticivorans TaxID=1306992 RepID=A0AAV3U4H5_9ALTE
MNSLVDFFWDFAYYYPLFMAYLWMIGGLYYRFHWEGKDGRHYDNPPDLPHYPPVTLLVPCHNEGENVRETIDYLLGQAYPEFEVIAVNDGSSDNTADILDELAAEHLALRVVHLSENSGKANALRVGTMVSKYEYLVCIDGDAVLDAHATTWLMKHFVESPRVGAVTGNPRIRNRTTLLGRLQVGEFSSIIGMIKRAQRIYGRIFTVSGVVAAFRKTALHRVGYWSTDMVTEDIDISWKLQLDHWDVRYEPNALVWILMPETLRGLWRQRLRWAQGGWETATRYFKSMLPWRKRRMWPVLLEYSVSLVWSYAVFTIVVLWILGKFIDMPPQWYVPTILPGWQGIILGVTCLLQFFVSLSIDSRYESGLLRKYFWMIWYPLAYWLINVITIVVAVPKSIFSKRGSRAVWNSPDRGIH